MNQMKLKMLIKFDQIKVIEDFYNSYFEQQPEEQIHLDLEISEFELQDLVEQIFRRNQELMVDQ